MHMKRVIIAGDDVHTQAWVEAAIEGLDVGRERCTLGELAPRLVSDPGDIAIVDAGRSPDAIAQLAERASAEGADLRVLFVVEAEALASLRLPVRFPSDFIVRGASAEEVTARVRGLLWPGEEVSGQEIVRIDDLTLNLATYQAYLRDEVIDFTYLEYALFQFLVTHPNRVYSREVLLRRVWGTDYFGGSRTVDVHVRRVRAKLGPEISRRLETVRNVGYLWKS